MNQKLVLLTLCVLLIGAAVASFLWQHDTIDPLQPGEPTDTHAVVAAAAVTASNTNVIEATADHAADTVRAAAAVATTNQPPFPDDARWLAITVIDKATGARVPGALVHWFGQSAWEQNPDTTRTDHENSILATDPELMGERYGWHTTTDSKGTANVAIKDWATVVARHETLYGTLQLQQNTIAPPEGHRLCLVPDREVFVQVLDDRSAPAPDVMIALGNHATSGELQQLWNWGPIAVTRAPDGLASIRHLQVIEVAAQKRHYPAQWRVRTFVPGHQDPGIALSLEQPPSEPIVLRLPACGRVRVRAEFGGQPMPGLTSVWLNDARRREVGGQTFGNQRLVDTDGWARFARVPLGQAYTATTSDVGDLRTEFTGPMAADQEVTVILAPTKDEILLRGRIVDSNRVPVCARLEVQARGPQFRAYKSLKTDAEGAFLIALGRAGKDNRTDQLWFAASRRGSAPLRVDVPPRELRAGVEDLGELVLGSGTLLAAGRFLCGDQPFTKNVQIWIERLEPATGDRPERWRRQPGTMPHQTDDTFEVRGTVPPGSCRLSCQSDRALPVEPIPFQLGATDLVVQVRAGQELAASALLPSEVPNDHVTAVLVPEKPVAPNATGPDRNPQRNTAQPWALETGERYNLQWQAVAAGSYTLELRLWAVPTPLVRITDVQVPGPEGGDPRLVDIDLRPFVRVLTVKLQDVTGKPLRDADGVIFPAGQKADVEWTGYQIDDATTRMLVRPGPLELLVAAERHRPQPVRADGDLVEVRLDPWPTIELMFPDLPPLPPKVTLVAWLQATEKSELAWRSPDRAGKRRDLLGVRDRIEVNGGKATVPIGDGPHALRLSLQGNRRSIEVGGVQPTQFLSNDGAVSVTVPAEQWQKAIELVKQPAK